MERVTEYFDFTFPKSEKYTPKKKKNQKKKGGVEKWKRTNTSNVHPQK